MVVALGALNGQAENAFADGVHPVEHRLHSELFGVDAALFIDHRVAQETRGHDLILSRVRQQVTGDLFDDELVVRLVGVERVDHPVAVEPDRPLFVLLEPVGIGVARGVEPMTPPPFAVMRRGQQSLDLFFIGVRTLVVQKRQPRR